MKFWPDKPKNLNPEKPKISLEKKYLWEKWTKIVDTIHDKIGHPVDKGIKESVIALNAYGVRTTGSCEGHLDRGLPYPWIDVEAFSKEEFQALFPSYPNKINEAREKGYKNLDEVKKKDPNLYEILFPATQYIEKANLELKTKVDSLLKEFYSNRKPYSNNGRIEIHGDRIELAKSRGVGLDNWKVFDDNIKRMSLKDKEVYLKNNQNEMKAFTEFLKDKFLSSK